MDINDTRYKVCPVCQAYLLTIPNKPGHRRCPTCRHIQNNILLEDSMIKIEEVNPHAYKLTDEQTKNVAILLDKINQIRTIYGKPMVVTSGIRSEADQARINPGAPKSKHLLGLAVDISDTDGKLMDWVLLNLDLMVKIGLWFEDFRWTKNWVHWQIVPPASGHRIFIPSTAPAIDPKKWSGVYDKKYDIKT